MSDRPRVAVTATQCWHRVPGGLASSTTRLLGAMAGSEQVELVAVGVAGRPRARGCTLPESVPLTRLGLPVPVLYDAWRFLGRPSVESAAGAIDLVHLTAPVAPRPGRTPWVATVHDLFPLTRPGDLTPRGVRLAVTGLRRIRDHARLVAVPSEVVAEDCRRAGFDPARVRVIPWGVEPAEVPDHAVDVIRRRLGLSGDYVLFVGTLEPRKGLDTLAEAMSRLDRPTLTLVVAGAPGWGIDARERFAGVSGPVLWVGHVAEDELAALRAGAAACCVPSHAEGFGLPALEALAAGAPLVTTSGTAMAEVAGDAALLVPPGDADALASALGSVLDDATLAAQLARRGRDRARCCSWQRTADAYVELYLDAIGRGA